MGNVVDDELACFIVELADTDIASLGVVGQVVTIAERKSSVIALAALMRWVGIDQRCVGASLIKSVWPIVSQLEHEPPSGRWIDLDQLVRTGSNVVSR